MSKTDSKDITIYQIWILVGYLMNRRVIFTTIDPRAFYFPIVNIETGLVEESIERNVIFDLSRKGYLSFSASDGVYSLTNLGFDIAHNRMKMVKAQVYPIPVIPNLGKFSENSELFIG